MFRLSQQDIFLHFDSDGRAVTQAAKKERLDFLIAKSRSPPGADFPDFGGPSVRAHFEGALSIYG